MGIILFLFIFINLFIKPSEYLSCGLFAWNGRYPSNFNISKFKILGIFNDDRGGDSCGVYANNSIEKGINNISKFKNFWKEYDFNNTKEAKVVIGHARKASVGNVSHENAQPIGVSFKTSKGGKKGLILAHNGTLTNHEELAEKYKLNIEKLSTDSQVLAYLLHLHGWKILEEYEGSAALIIHSISEPDTIYVFKGASKFWHSSSTPSEERPLFYYQENKNSIYFSSIEDSLTLLIDDIKSEDLNTNKIKEVPENILFKVKNGVMTELHKIDRSSIAQKSSSQYAKGFCNTVNRAVYNRYDMDGYEDYYDADRYGNFNHNFNVNKKLDVDKEPIDGSAWGNKDYLYYCRLRYYIDQKLAHGSYIVTSMGKVYSSYEKALDNYKSSSLRKLYFCRGILVKNKEAYVEATKIYANTTDSGFETYEIIRKMEEYSVYPIHIISSAGWVVKKTGENTSLYWNGSFIPMFSNKEYSVSFGDLKRIKSREYHTGAKDVFYPDFEKYIDVFVDGESSDVGGDLYELGKCSFDFENEKHKQEVEKSIQENAVVDNLEKETGDIIIDPTSQKSAVEEVLEYQIKKIKNDIIGAIGDFQNDLIELELQTNLTAAELYNKCDKFVLELNNDLPF